MATYDRTELLARTDLAELADQVLGPRKGRGGGATWPCPSPNHGPQTGKTPPVSIFRATTGDQRWRCHGCGDGGTAVDLVMRTQGVDVRGSLELLAKRTGVEPASQPPQVQQPRPETSATSRPPGAPALEAYVARCEAVLWSSSGRIQRLWLKSRGLREEVLRANRVGADPGPRVLSRPPGLPHQGPAVVLPVLGADGRAEYLQARYLRAGPRKYDNPSAALVGTSPRVAEVRLARPAVRDDVVVVCEGLPDALTAAQAGYPAVAVLGAAYPDEKVASALVARYGRSKLAIAFDADQPGREGAERLADLLGGVGAGDRTIRLHIPTHEGDLNDWCRAVGGERFGTELGVALCAAGLSDRQVEHEAAPLTTSIGPEL